MFVEGSKLVAAHSTNWGLCLLVCEYCYIIQPTPNTWLDSAIRAEYNTVYYSNIGSVSYYGTLALFYDNYELHFDGIHSESAHINTSML